MVRLFPPKLRVLKLFLQFRLFCFVDRCGRSRSSSRQRRGKPFFRLRRALCAPEIPNDCNTQLSKLTSGTGIPLERSSCSNLKPIWLPIRLPCHHTVRLQNLLNSDPNSTTLCRKSATTCSRLLCKLCPVGHDFCQAWSRRCNSIFNSCALADSTLQSPDFIKFPSSHFSLNAMATRALQCETARDMLKKMRLLLQISASTDRSWLTLTTFLIILALERLYLPCWRKMAQNCAKGRLIGSLINICENVFPLPSSSLAKTKSADSLLLKCITRSDQKQLARKQAEESSPAR